MAEDPYLRADRDDAMQALQNLLTALDDSSLDREAVRDIALAAFSKITLRRMGVAPAPEPERDDLIPVRIGPKEEASRRG